MDEVSGLEMMLVTASVRARRNETSFSSELFFFYKKIGLNTHVAVLKHRLRGVAVQELTAEIGDAAGVEDVLAELESKSHRGVAPETPQPHSDARRIA